MIRVLVAGGCLQGTEAAYLSKKAGYFTIVADAEASVPARGIADRFIQADFCDPKAVSALFSQADVIIPALENREALSVLAEAGRTSGKPVIFDEANYAISSSKTLSNELFAELSLALPEKYPGCPFPVILKADGLSGSRHVYKAFSQVEADRLRERIPGRVVIQQYLEGRSFSMEGVGDGTRWALLPVTEVIVDAAYDCKRVIAPADIPDGIRQQFTALGERLARKLLIKGIFDIEVIEDKGVLKLLEIDARFPSQTPVSVYQSSGINMARLLVEAALGKTPGDGGLNGYAEAARPQVCFYQQIGVTKDRVFTAGEHIISESGPLSLEADFFGADEALTNYRPEAETWEAIVIITASSYEKVEEKFRSFISRISDFYGGIPFQEG
jgi:pyrrolysine biosynthesis protein PylC